MPMPLTTASDAKENAIRDEYEKIWLKSFFGACIGPKSINKEINVVEKRFNTDWRQVYQNQFISPADTAYNIYSEPQELETFV